jgi:PRC-barrel domain
MSRRPQARTFHLPIVPIIVPIIAFLIIASSSFCVHAQQTEPSNPTTGDPNPSGVAPARPPETTGREPPSAPAREPTLPIGEGIPAMVVGGEQVDGILGKKVRSRAGEDMGRIVDVLVDRSARVRAAVIDFGGFLGVGNRQIAVAWSAIRFSGQGKPDILIVDFTRDQLRVAPVYKAGEQIVLLGPPGNPNSQSAGALPDNPPASNDPPTK